MYNEFIFYIYIPDRYIKGKKNELKIKIEIKIYKFK